MSKSIQAASRLGLWQVILASSLWGTIGIATQAIYRLEDADSLFINLTRMVIAAPLLLLAAWRVLGVRMFHFQRRDLFIMLLAGMLLALSQASYFAAIRYSGVTIATLLTLCLTPLVVSGLSIAFQLEPFTRRTALAVVLALSGGALLVGFPAQATLQSETLLGVLFAAGAALTYGGMMLCGRSVAGRYPSLQVSAFNFVAGIFTLVVLNLATEARPTTHPSAWLIILYLGLVPTALAYWLFQVGLRHVSATTASIVTMLESVVAAVLAWLLFGETLSLLGLAGAGLLLLSIALLASAEQDPQSVRPPS